MYANSLNKNFFIYFFFLSFILTNAGGVHNLQGIIEEWIEAKKAAFEGDSLQVI